jgi:hypothetical protein
VIVGMSEQDDVATLEAQIKRAMAMLGGVVEGKTLEERVARLRGLYDELQVLYYELEAARVRRRMV